MLQSGNKIKRKAVGSLVFVYLAAFVTNIFLASVIAELNSVHAAGFANAAIRHSRMVVNHVASGTDPILVVLKASAAGAGTEDSIGLSFGSGYTVDSTASNITITTTGIPATFQGVALNAAPIVGAAATAVSSRNVTIDCTDFNGNLFGFYITGGITNPAATGAQTIKVSTHSDTTPDFSGYTDAIDSTRIATYFVADNGSGTDGDQIVVTARVSPTYTFALSANAITLDTALATVEYPGGAQNGAVSPVTATVTTNANNGHAMWIKSATSAGLTSSTLSASIPFSGTAADGNPTTINAGTEGVVIDVNSNTNTSGTLTIAGEFNGTTTSAGGTPSTTFQEIASASGPAGTAGDKVDIIPRVAISATTQSADDYTQTFTVIGAGNF
ncbi:MAG: hypothetical protein U0525_01455 [Patescibacteria group bacterium]